MNEAVSEGSCVKKCISAETVKLKETELWSCGMWMSLSQQSRRMTPLSLWERCNSTGNSWGPGVLCFRQLPVSPVAGASPQIISLYFLLANRSPCQDIVCFSLVINCENSICKLQTDVTNTCWRTFVPTIYVYVIHRLVAKASVIECGQISSYFIIKSYNIWCKVIV